MPTSRPRNNYAPHLHLQRRPPRPFLVQPLSVVLLLLLSIVVVVVILLLASLSHRLSARRGGREVPLGRCCLRWSTRGRGQRRRGGGPLATRRGCSLDTWGRCYLSSRRGGSLNTLGGRCRALSPQGWSRLASRGGRRGRWLSSWRGCGKAPRGGCWLPTGRGRRLLGPRGRCRPLGARWGGPTGCSPSPTAALLAALILLTTLLLLIILLLLLHLCLDHSSCRKGPLPCPPLPVALAAFPRRLATPAVAPPSTATARHCRAGACGEGTQRRFRRLWGRFRSLRGRHRDGFEACMDGTGARLHVSETLPYTLHSPYKCAFLTVCMVCIK